VEGPNIRGRIKILLDYKKPPFWVVIGAVIVCAAVFLCLPANPESGSGSLHEYPYAKQLDKTGPFAGYDDGDADTFDVYTEAGGTYIMSLPWSLFDGFPASDRTSPDREPGWMKNVDIYCGAFDSFAWAVVCTGPSMGAGNANVCTSADGGKTWRLGDRNAMHSGTVTGAGFASPEVGFISYRYYIDDGPEISRTLDGGKTWELMDVTVPDEYQADGYRFTPLSPQFNGLEGVYPILVYKWRGDDNYDQETIYMYSHNGGLSWSFE